MVFRGPPQRLSAVIPVMGRHGPVQLGDAEAELAGVAVESVRVRSIRGAAASTVRLRLPLSTAPGKYEGRARMGEYSLAIIAQVDPHPRLFALPRPLHLEGGPGMELAAVVVLVNTGNVACDVSGRSSIGLLPEGSFGAAFWRAVTARSANGRQRADLLIDALAEDASPVRVIVAAGEGTVEPGESREVRVSFRLPDALVEGRTYAGSWEPPGLRLPVRVSVSRQARTQDKGAAK